MRFRTLAVAHLLVAALAEPLVPYRLASMSTNPALGLAKRQNGYQPSQTQCGAGNTCEISCGPTYATCPSNDGQLHCYDPTIKESCCPDGTGNSCSDGYYCTKDSVGGTWCCPDELSLAQCAAVYTITGGLVSETSVGTSSSSVSSVASTPSSSSAVTSSSVYTTSSSSVYTTPSSTVYTTSSSTVYTISSAVYTTICPAGTAPPALSQSGVPIPYPQGNGTSLSVPASVGPTTPTAAVQYKSAASANTRFWGLLGALGMVGAFVAL